MGAIMVLASTSFVSCKKDKVATSSDSGMENKKAKTMSAKAAAPNFLSVVKGHFNFIDIKQNVDISKDAKMMAVLANDELISKNKLSSELNLEQATLYYINEAKMIMIVPFIINGDNKVLSISIEDYRSTSYVALPSMYIENKLDASLTGTSTICYYGGSIISEVTYGNIGRQETMGGRSAFRICFDNCYDEICDGPTGCLAWYTNPSIAVMVIAYCTVKTN